MSDGDQAHNVTTHNRMFCRTTFKDKYLITSGAIIWVKGRFRLLPASNSWDCMYRKSSNENYSSPVIKDFSGHWRKLIKITEASLSISSVSSVACTYMWSNGVGTVSIRMARKISSTLINIWDIKGFWEYDAYINLLMLNVECILSSCFQVGWRIFIFFHWWKILR